QRRRKSAAVLWPPFGNGAALIPGRPGDRSGFARCFSGTSVARGGGVAIMALYPIFLKLQERKVLIVGAGAVAGEKIHAVLRPALAQRIRKKLEQEFGPEYESWVAWLGRIRAGLLKVLPRSETRKQLLHLLAESGPQPLAEKRSAGQ